MTTGYLTSHRTLSRSLHYVFRTQISASKFILNIWQLVFGWVWKTAHYSSVALCVDSELLTNVQSILDNWASVRFLDVVYNWTWSISSPCRSLTSSKRLLVILVVIPSFTNVLKFSLVVPTWQVRIYSNSSKLLVLNCSVWFMLRKFLICSIPLLSWISHCNFLLSIAVLLEFIHTVIVHSNLRLSFGNNSLATFAIWLNKCVSSISWVLINGVCINFCVSSVRRYAYWVSHSLCIKSCICLLLFHILHWHFIHRYNYRGDNRLIKSKKFILTTPVISSWRQRTVYNFTLYTTGILSIWLSI